MSHHGNSHRSSTPGAVKRLRIEQAIARHGTPHKAAEATGYPLADCMRVWDRMNQIVEEWA